MPRLVNSKTHEIRYIELYRALPNTNSRPREWLTRAMASLSKAPEEILDKYTNFHFYDDSDLSELSFGCYETLLLLTYHPRSALYRELIKQIEEESGLSLPVKRGYSRYEDSFAVKLDELLSEIIPNKHHYKLHHQKKIGSYFVDFYVEIRLEHKFSYYIIEFDEEAHQKKKSYIRNDPKRDAYFRENEPYIRLIRVRHSEMELWFTVVRKYHKLLRLEDVWKKLIISASKPYNSNYRIMNQSTIKGVSQDDIQLLLNDTKQPFHQLKLILKRLNVHFKEAPNRSIVFSRHTLNRR